MKRLGLVLLLGSSLYAMEEEEKTSKIEVTNIHESKDTVILQMPSVRKDLCDQTIGYYLGRHSPGVRKSILPYFMQRLEDKNIMVEQIPKVIPITEERRETIGSSDDLQHVIKTIVNQSLEDAFKAKKEKLAVSRRRTKWAIIANGVTGILATVLIIVLESVRSSKS